MKKSNIEVKNHEIIDLRKFRIVMKMVDPTNKEPQLLLFLLIMYKKMILSNNILSFYDFLNSDNKNKSAFFSSDIYLRTMESVSNLDRLVIENIQKFFTRIPDELIENHFNKVFETVLLEINNSHSYRRINETLPIEVIQLIKDLNIIKDTNLIYNPFSGQSSFNTVFNENIFHNQEINNTTREIAILRLNANNLEKSIQLENGDSICNWNPNNIKYNTIITAPPFGMRVRSEFDRIPESIESHVIKKGIESLTPDGKLILIIPSGFLTSHKDKQLKEWLINSNLLETIVSLPGRTLNNTAISISILVINKNKNTDLITLINGTECVKNNKENALQGRSSHSALDNEKLINLIRKDDPKVSVNITSERIKKDEYNLNPSRYFIDNILNDDLQRLDEVSQLFRGERQNDTDSILVKIGDLDNDALGSNLNINSIKKGFIKGPVQMISESCLLLATIGHTLKPTWFKYEGTPISIRNGIIPIRINTDKINIDYIVQELSSDNVTKQLSYLTTGSTISFYKKNDILGLKIFIPKTIEEQEDISKKIKEAILTSKRIELGLEYKNQKSIAEYKQNLKQKRHDTLQFLKPITDSVKSLLIEMENNEGILDGDKKINPNNNRTIKDRLIGIKNNLSIVSNLIIDFVDDIEYGKKEIIDANEFIKSISNRIDLEIIFLNDTFILEDEEINESTLTKPLFEFSRKNLEVLIQNIYDNAKEHGDIENNPYFKFICEISCIEGEFLKLSFQNNGKPFIPKMAQSYHIKGSKAGINSGTGYGGWRVSEIAKHFGGKLEIEDLPDDEFPVRINLIVPLKIDENE
jgi:type I restriction enzyme M protein